MPDKHIDPAKPDVLNGPPSGYFVIVPPRPDEEAFDVATVVSVIGAAWKVLLFTLILGGGVAGAVSFFIRPVFRSETLVVPVTQKGTSAASGGALRGQLGGLAALAGIDVTGGSGSKEEAIATLSSSGFARDFIASEQLMPILFPKKWDAQAKGWKAGVTPPTMEDAVKLFTEEVRTVSEDRTSGLLTMKVEWYSPDLAARWANGMIEKVNERLRSHAIRDSERSIDFLNKELAKTNVVELRQAVYRLIEEQVNNAMLANVQYEYAFRVIDPAVAPVKRASPRRVAMTIIGAVFGLFAGAAWALLRHQLRRPPPQP